MPENSLARPETLVSAIRFQSSKSRKVLMKSIAYMLFVSMVVMLGSSFRTGEVRAQENDWTDALSLIADVRLQYDGIFEDGEEDRERARYRGHIGASMRFTDKLSGYFVYGTNGDNPVSGNEVFDGHYRLDDLGVEFAYLDWSANDKTDIYFGKMRNPFFRPGGAPMIWDSDFNPEGLALNYHAGMLFGSVAAFVVEKRSSADDSHLFAAQGGFRHKLATDDTLTAGLGYYDYTNTIGNQPFKNRGARGNTVDANGNLVFDYGTLQLFVEYDTSFGELPFAVFADYGQNTEVSANDAAYSIGFKAGRAKAPGTWQASWAYQDIQADAVIGAFNDSDFGGGGTDASGHLIKAKYVLAERWTLGGTLIITEVEKNAGSNHDYSRLQLDVEFKF
jgi:hypothetical protein